ncbi:MAG: signal transduction histidine kinase [Bacillales bacterium]|nr:signal transduction histidine kinase [Bacillales bacterium]
MDIKSKKYNPLLKGLAITSVIVFGCLLLFLIIGNIDGLTRLQDIRDLNEKDYTKTISFNNEKGNISYEIQNLYFFANDKKIEEKIRNEIQEIKENEFEATKEELKSQFLNEGHSISELTEQKLWEAFEAQTKLKFDSLYNNKFQSFKESNEWRLRFLENNKNIVYRIVIDGKQVSNTTKNFNQIKSNYRYSEIIDPSESEISDSEKSIFAFKNEYLDKMSAQFDNLSKELIKCICYIMVILISICYLTFAAGKKDSDPSRMNHLFIDKMYNEISFGFLFLSGFAIVACFIGIFEKILSNSVMVVLLSGSISLFIVFYLILIRHFKSRTLFTNTIVYKILNKIFHGFKKVYNLGTPLTKVFFLIVFLGILTMIPFVGFITVPLIMWLVYRQMDHFIKLKNGIREIRFGTYHAPIEIVGDGEFAQLAQDVNAIAAGLGDEVERRMKSERLKTELIVNVSHDIRTPLTSLVTYVDLLKKEPTNSVDAQKYLDVIEQKTERLKVLIDDLFDAAKASSGNINVNFEKVDVGSLLIQGMAELDEKINTSTLDFKIQVPENKVYVRADGKLLWRVVDNLLSNVLKYSLSNSRVYIQLIDEPDRAIIEIKNISAAELNIAEDEITERFIRGDQSRTSEGSGLGLDIAKSLMACQNGSLNIKIDGDLFKASVSIPKYEM